jgi:hypothetical protein
MPDKFKFLSMFNLVGFSNGSEVIPNRDGTYTYELVHILILIDEVQKSGAKIYYRPANFDFTADGGKTFYPSHREAYKSEDW